MDYGSIKAAVKNGLDLSEKAQRVGYSLLHLLNHEFTSSPNLSLERRVWAYRHGFVSSSVPSYGLDEMNQHEYLSQWEERLARQINGETALIYENKLLFYYVLWPLFSDVLPELYGYLHEGNYLDIPFSSSSYDHLLDCVDREGKLVIKPISGFFGNDVHVLERKDGTYYIDGTSDRSDQIDRLVRQGDDYIVTEFAEQADYAATIYPRTPNSMRIMTMIDPDTREPFIGALSHRFGTAESIPVDDVARGGLSASIDLDTGQLESAAAVRGDETLERYDVHPETGTPITGVEVPGWDRICTGILDMADYLAPTTPYTGWDVLVTDENGSFVVLEANSYPDAGIQMHGPLLADERNRRFYEHYGVV